MKKQNRYIIVFLTIFLGGLLYFFQFNPTLFQGFLLPDESTEVSETLTLQSEDERVSQLQKLETLCRQNQPIEYNPNQLTYAEGRKKYHTFINCIIEETRLQMLSAVKDTETNNTNVLFCDATNKVADLINNIPIADITTVTNPETQEEQKVPIGIAIIAADEYKRYRTFLDQVQRNPTPSVNTFDEAQKPITEINTQQEEANQNTELVQTSIEISLLSETIDTQGKIVREIQQEKIRSKQALDISLRALNEMRIALPLHKKYECIITNLQKYRDEFARLRRIVECLPGKFKEPRTDA